MYYEEGYREKVIGFLKRGKSESETAEAFGVSRSSIWRWQQLEREQGHFKNRPLKRKYKKVNPEDVNKYIDNHKDVNAVELAEKFKIKTQSMLYILKKKLKYVCKKNSEPIVNGTKVDESNLEKKSNRNNRKRLYMWMKQA